MQKVPTVADVTELSGTYDIALIATKAAELPDAAKGVLPFLGQDSLVVSLQNSICIDTLKAIVGGK